MNVVDASVAVKWFVAEPGHAEALALLASGSKLVAPDLVLVEVANALRRKFKRGELNEVQWREAVDALPLCFDSLFPSVGLMASAMENALRLDHPVYDCLYLAAVSSRSLLLISADQAFVDKCQHAGIGDAVISLDAWHQAHRRTTIDDGVVRRVLALHARFEKTLDAVRDLVASPLGEGRFRITRSEDLEPAFDSPTYLALRNAIVGMNRRDRAELLALGWLGQGYSGDDWSSILRRAGDYLSDDPETHIAYLISKIFHVEAGLGKRDAQRPEPTIHEQDET